MVFVILLNSIEYIVFNFFGVFSFYDFVGERVVKLWFKLFEGGLDVWMSMVGKVSL